MKAEKKLVNKLKDAQDDGIDTGVSFTKQTNVSCNVEECYFESYGACLANNIIITPAGCITDRNLVED